jgi:hypothetical protein
VFEGLTRNANVDARVAEFGPDESVFGDNIDVIAWFQIEANVPDPPFITNEVSIARLTVIGLRTDLEQTANIRGFRERRFIRSEERSHLGQG